MHVTGPVAEQMVVPRLIISTCGTSLLTNHAADAAAVLRRTATSAEIDLDTAERRELDEHIAGCRARLLAADANVAANLSAELRALFMNGDLGPERRGQDHHVLISNDTFQGRQVAEMLRNWLEQRHIAVEQVDVAGLAPTRYQDFRVALGDLARVSMELIERHRKTGRRIIFNLNGGFKAVQGFMQTLGCHCADECIYVFESGREIMRVPRLPMVLDPDGVVGRYLPQFRAMAAGRPLPSVQTAGIPETLLFELDGQAILSEWGEIVWHNARDRHYGKHLLPPPDAGIAYSKRFTGEAERLPPDRLIQLNRQIDALAAHFRRKAWNPKSLSFKPLQGNPIKGSTHEFYAWSDGNAARVFGHYRAEGGCFEVDQLGPHL
jgi:putative CRISPR-associated protein (TIGR02619 family)